MDKQAYVSLVTHCDWSAYVSYVIQPIRAQIYFNPPITDVMFAVIFKIYIRHSDAFPKIDPPPSLPVLNLVKNFVVCVLSLYSSRIQISIIKIFLEPHRQKRVDLCQN